MVNTRVIKCMPHVIFFTFFQSNYSEIKYYILYFLSFFSCKLIYIPWNFIIIQQQKTHNCLIQLEFTRLRCEWNGNENNYERGVTQGTLIIDVTKSLFNILLPCITPFEYLMSIEPVSTYFRYTHSAKIL